MIIDAMIDAIIRAAKTALLAPLIMGVVLGLGGLTACQDSASVKARVEAAQERNDGPPIFRVRAPRGGLGGGDELAAQLYLYGAVHILPEGLDWQRADLADTLAKSGTVFFETNQDEEAQKRIQVLAAKYGYYSGGRNLPRELDGYEQKLLLAATLNAGREPGDFDAMQPWRAAGAISQATLSQAGIVPEHGADNILHKRASLAGKYIRYLETSEEHMSGTATLPHHVQMDMLRRALAEAPDLAERTQRLNMEWARGNLAYIEDEIVAPLKVEMPELYEALLTIRNQAWAQDFDAFLQKGGQNGLAIVGVAHLAGEDSVVKMLADRGYEVERYYAYRGENVIKTIDLYPDD